MRLILSQLLLLLLLGCVTKQTAQINEPLSVASLPLASPILFTQDIPSKGVLHGQKNEIPNNVREVLNSADKIEILLLRPGGTSYHPAWKFKLYSNGKYFGNEILGRAFVRGTKGKGEFLNALYASVASTPFEDQSMCFEAKHGLRASYRGKTVALLISFRCQNFYLYTADDQTHPPLFAISEKVRETFDRILKEANVAVK
jgi:hypothetical protein